MAPRMDIDAVLTAARRTLASLTPGRTAQHDQAAVPGEIEKRILRSPAGKSHAVPYLLPLLPAHRRYVEPFAGSAALFFAKAPAAEEVLSDLDPEIVFAYRFVQRMTPETLARLKRLHWKNSRSYFERLKARTPRSDLERFHTFIYLNRFSYFSKGGRHASYNPAEEGQVFRAFDKFPKGQERLRNATILQGSYEKVIRRYDGPGTLFFLDPPFPGYGQRVGERDFDEERFAQVLRSIRGKFLVTYGLRSDRSLFKAFHMRRITLLTATPAGLDRRPLLLIANYELPRRVRPAARKAAASNAWPARPAAVEQPAQKDEAASEPAAGAAASKPSANMPVAQNETGMHKGAAPAPAPTPAPPALDDELRPLCDRAVGLAQTIVKRGTDEERFTLGIVLEPDVVDAQNDRYTKAEVRRACHRFAEHFGNTGLMHRELAGGRIVIVENYLAPCDFTADSGAQVKQGTWLQGRKYRDDEIWQKIKSGELTGLSIGGSAIRRMRAEKDPRADDAGEEQEEQDAQQVASS